MGKKIIEIDGKKYPCYSTMGAMLRYRQETGSEVDTMRGLSEMLTYLWCCVVSACKREGVSFDMSLMDFADAVNVSDMQSWIDDMSEAVTEDDGNAGKKK